jgi:hypothetical protein
MVQYVNFVVDIVLMTGSVTADRIVQKMQMMKAAT